MLVVQFYKNIYIFEVIINGVNKAALRRNLRCFSYMKNQ